MNRKIKFRVWDKNRKKYADTFDVTLTPHGVIKYHLEGFKDRFIAEQFTGVKDRENKEIYEGDIVEIPGYTFNSGKQGSIIFYNGSFRVNWGGNIGALHLNYYTNTCKIIGNIHEKENS